MNRDEIAKLFPLIEEITGFSSHCISEGVIESVIRYLMKNWNCQNAQETAELITSSPLAQEQLITQLTVKETYFFREERAIVVAVQEILPSVLQKKEQCIIASAGCSTGAELYSLVLAIDNEYGEQVLNSCHFIGFDIDPSAIAIAQKGVFGARNLRALPDHMKQRYFHKTDQGDYMIADSIKKRVKFSIVNLTQQQQLDSIPFCDLLFYRNVSIYFAPQTRKRVFDSLVEKLHWDGALFTGTSETLHHSSDFLTLIESQGIFYFLKKIDTKEKQKVVSFTPIPHFSPKKVAYEKKVERLQRPSQPPAKRIPKKEDIEAQVIQLVRNGSISQAQKMIDDIKEPSQNIPIIQAGIWFEQNRREEAKSLCLHIIKEEIFSIEAFILLGLLYHTEKSYEPAIMTLKHALYHDPHCWIAHYYIARSYQELTMIDLALRSYKRTLESLEKPSKKNELLLPFTLQGEAQREIGRLCSIAINSLKT